MYTFLKQTSFNDFLKYISIVLLFYITSRFFIGLDNYSLNYDELFTHYLVSQKNAKNFFYALFYRERTPPFYYAFLKLFDPFVVWNEVSLRFFSAVSISAAVYVSYSYIKKKYSIFFALCFLVLLIGNNSMLTLSQLARGYAFASLFATLGYISFLNIVSDIDSMKNFKKMLIAIIFLSFTHYVGLLFSICLLLLVILHKYKIVNNYIFRNKIKSALMVLPVITFIFFHNMYYFSQSFKINSILVGSNTKSFSLFNSFIFSPEFTIIFLIFFVLLIVQYLYSSDGLRGDFRRIMYSVVLIVMFVIFLQTVFNIFNITNDQLQYVLFAANIPIIVLIMIFSVFHKMCKSFFVLPSRKIFYSHFLVISICSYIFITNINNRKDLFFRSNYRAAFSLLAAEVKIATKPYYIFVESSTPLDTLLYYTDRFRIYFSDVLDSSLSVSNKMNTIKIFIEKKSPNEFFILKSTIGFVNEDNVQYNFAGYSSEKIFSETHIEITKYKIKY